MVTKTLLETIFPSVIVDNFDIVSIQHYRKDEEIGFTSAKKIQDYPIRGNAVYLHVRRRKWLDQDTNEVLAKTYSIAFEGTQLTKEFVSFLKEAYRVHGLEY